MIDPGINPHEVAKEELLTAMVEGARFASDLDIVVLADIHVKDKSKRE